MDKVFSEKINLLKALAILLVVSGHLEFSLIPMFPPYSFQLAFFFFISGMLFNEKYLTDVSTYFKRRVQTLLVPYFLYEIFYYIVTFVIFHFTGKWWGEEISLKNFFVTPFLNGHQLNLACPLWFVPQLFITMMTFLFTMKILKKLSDNKIFHFIIFLIFGFCSIPLIKIVEHTDLNLIIFRTVFSMFFVYLGYFYTNFVKDKINIFAPKWIGLLILVQSILWLFNRDYNPEHGIGLSYVLVWARFDEQIIVPVLTSITGIWFCLLIVHALYDYIKDIKFVKLMGENTFHIMANHLLVMYIITAIIFKIQGIAIEERAAHNIYWIWNPIQTTFLYFVLTMYITTWIAVLQKKIKKIIVKK